MFQSQPPVVFAHGGNRARLHLRQALATGKHRRAGMSLNHPPQRLTRQVAEFAARPLPVVHFGEPVLDQRLQAQRFGERFHGAPASQHWRADQGPDRQLTDPIDQAHGLLAALVVEVDALGAASQHARGVRGRSAVS